MNIAVNLRITMTGEQVAAYAREYGLNPDDLPAIRDDVKQYMLTAAQDCTAAEFWTATLKR